MTALCAKRPTWGRRGFLALLGAAAVGAVLPKLPAPTAQAIHTQWIAVTDMGDGGAVKLYTLNIEPMLRKMGVAAEQVESIAAHLESVRAAHGV